MVCLPIKTPELSRVRNYRSRQTSTQINNGSVMATLLFNFKAPNGTNWDMAAACQSPSKNPVTLASNPCIYIIHNSNTNHTYVGYAKNAKKRWDSRTEAFFCMGIQKKYAAKVLCAYCYPKLGNTNVPFGSLKGQNNAEHALIRAVKNGLLGKTTSTNTSLRQTEFDPNFLVVNGKTVDRIQVSLPATGAWGHLESDKITQQLNGNKY
ncbi:GIY-YIG nuclease family protein [Vibrio tubiashii]|uniref:GIY-YIG nuclease family protein n=1 Tax=Vibrio tubiashii TaxID=29498 RepID=UPI001EFD0FD4|nr:GIY-YIG nuclease family protein [Vibrio tubiashii]MCG9575378.1 GIY-YIG nuclease family protein [Vibrio tubiashii]